MFITAFSIVFHNKAMVLCVFSFLFFFNGLYCSKLVGCFSCLIWLLQVTGNNILYIFWCSLRKKDDENQGTHFSLRQNQSRFILSIIALKFRHNWVFGQGVTCDGSPHRWATWHPGRGSEDRVRRGLPRSPSSSAPGCHPHLLTQDHTSAQHLHLTELLGRFGRGGCQPASRR